jgi:hypothetical protein
VTSKVTPATRLLLSAAIALSCGGSPAAPGQSLSVTTLANFSAADGVFGTETLQVIRDQAAWQSLWSRMNSNHFPAPALPAVDFSAEMVVVAAVGGKPSGGFSVSVDSASERSGTVIVEVTMTSPGPNCIVAGLMTSPVATAKLPTRTGAVNFNVTRRVTNCKS